MPQALRPSRAVTEIEVDRVFPQIISRRDLAINRCVALFATHQLFLVVAAASISPQFRVFPDAYHRECDKGSLAGASSTLSLRERVLLYLF